MLLPDPGNPGSGGKPSQPVMYENKRKDDDHRSLSWSTQDQPLLASGICISAAISFFFRFKSKVLSFQIEVGESTINCDVVVVVTMSHGWL